MNDTLLDHALRDALDPGPILERAAMGSALTRVTTPLGRYVAKWHRDRSPLDAEAEGLAWLRRAASGLHIPAPLALVSDGQDSLLLTNWLEATTMSDHHAERLGTGLASLHRHLGERYGWNADNFIGATPQRNAWDEAWPRFFAERRLGDMAERLAATGRWTARRDRALGRLIAELPSLLPDAPPPSLLHGDLWGGNALALADGGAALIDPAPYFGDREADLAMTQLFGGFPRRFYDAYRAAWPLEPGAAERVPIYNLYHLLNHLLLFGHGYGARVDQLLGPFA